MKPEISCARAVFCLAFAVILGLAGCEGDGEDHIWDGFDFGDNDPNRYVTMGDSITSGYGLDSVNDAYPNKLSGLLGKIVVNHGVQGSKSSYGAEHVNAVLNIYKPGYLLILYGVNDLIHGYSVAEILSNFRTMIAAAKANQTIPVIATLTPVFEWYVIIDGQIATLNAGIRLMAAEEDIHVADLDRAFNGIQSYLCEDGLHPNSAGHDLMAATFYDILK